MSSIPGYTMEDFIQWNHNLKVENRDDVNFSLATAEALGTISKRLILTSEEFSAIINLYEQAEPSEDGESLRVRIERRLEDFDEDNMSWRDYAGYVFDFIDDEYPLLEFSVRQLLTDYNKSRS